MSPGDVPIGPGRGSNAAHRRFPAVCRVGILLILFCLFPPYHVQAQTAQELETLLETKAVSYAAAARFVLEASGAAVISDPDEAFRFAMEQKWFPKQAAADRKVKLSGLSLLLMRSFNVKGGLFYTIFKNPHYAYRELVYQQILMGKTDPDKTVPGDEFLFLVGRFLSMQEEP